mmetsp:Transcript_16738/g.35372  ORF Transcript_16738/g.35372 Transcript_16738/m.35372 type:complete len:1101 (+) Transcript_16738:261-3563(+)
MTSLVNILTINAYKQSRQRGRGRGRGSQRNHDALFPPIKKMVVVSDPKNTTLRSLIQSKLMAELNSVVTTSGKDAALSSKDISAAKDGREDQQQKQQQQKKKQDDMIIINVATSNGIDVMELLDHPVALLLQQFVVRGDHTSSPEIAVMLGHSTLGNEDETDEGGEVQDKIWGGVLAFCDILAVVAAAIAAAATDLLELAQSTTRTNEPMKSPWSQPSILLVSVGIILVLHSLAIIAHAEGRALEIFVGLAFCLAGRHFCSGEMKMLRPLIDLAGGEERLSFFSLGVRERLGHMYQNVAFDVSPSASASAADTTSQAQPNESNNAASTRNDCAVVDASPDQNNVPEEPQPEHSTEQQHHDGDIQDPGENPNERNRDENVKGSKQSEEDDGDAEDDGSITISSLSQPLAVPFHGNASLRHLPMTNDSSDSSDLNLLTPATNNPRADWRRSSDSSLLSMQGNHKSGMAMASLFCPLASPTAISSSFHSSRRNTSSKRNTAGKDQSLSSSATTPSSSSSSKTAMGKGFFYSKAWKEHKKKRKKRSNNRNYGATNDAAVRREGTGVGDAQTNNEEYSHGGIRISRSVDDEILLKRDLSRRKRRSFFMDDYHPPQELSSSSLSMRSSTRTMEPTDVTAFRAARVESERPVASSAEHTIQSHAAPFARAMTKSHMADVSLAGKDGVVVRTSRFVLACYSPMLEEVFFKGTECSYYNADASIVNVAFCNEEVMMAAVHYCFCGELPPEFLSLNNNGTEDAARNLARLDHLAHVLGLETLGELTYRAARRVVNRRAVLACAIFDELSYREEIGPAENSIKRYALDTMREMPMDTLLDGGVRWMKEGSLEAVMRDQDMDVDEFYMFKILNAWTVVDRVTRLPVAQRLSGNIELKFIDPELLATTVKDSGYFEESVIDEAIALIEESLANRDASEMERVLVEGAGTDIVNGIYFRVEEEVGMGEEEVLFVKEADDGYSDVGLFLWGKKWQIAMCADYSNCFYSCEDPPNKSNATEFIPRDDWVAQYRGQNPPPNCTYLPITRLSRLSSSGTSEKVVMAPNIEEMIDPTIAEKRRSGYFDRRVDNVVIEKRTMTLEQMMNLPEDRVEVREE